MSKAYRERFKRGSVDKFEKHADALWRALVRQLKHAATAKREKYRRARHKGIKGGK